MTTHLSRNHFLQAGGISEQRNIFHPRYNFGTHILCLTREVLLCLLPRYLLILSRDMVVGATYCADCLRVQPCCWAYCWAYCVAIFCCHADCLNQFYSKYCYSVQMAYQAWSHQPMVVEPEEATKHPSRADKVTSNGHRHQCQSPYLVAKPLSDPFPIFVLNHYLPLPAVFRPSSLSNSHLYK